MSKIIENRIQKLLDKQAKLAEQLKELEEAKKMSQLSADSEDIQSLKGLIEETATKYKTSPAKLLRLLSSVIKGERIERVVKVAAVKYRDTAPGNENNTWTGRGLAPLWLQRYEAVGRNRAEFLVG